MDNWIKRIDDFLKRQKLAAEKLSRAKIAEEEALKLAQNEPTRKERENKLEELGKKCHCQISGCETATIPGYKREYDTNSIGMSSEDRQCYAGGGWSNVEDLSVPGNLHICIICHRWICEKHIHEQICQECGEKL